MKSLLLALRHYKITYIFYNFLKKKQLQHNKQFYKKYKVNKPLFWSLSSKDFKNKQGELPWLDRPNATDLLEKQEFPSTIYPNLKHHLKDWIKDGYLILPNFFSDKEADAVNDEIQNMLSQKKIGFMYGRKIMFANKKSELIKSIASDKRLVELLSIILGTQVIPFQTINFLEGSEQRAHSDSIHMTTFPLGNLIAVWIALEDTNMYNGPLHYYPGSHRLPYLLNENYHSGGNYFKVSINAYKRYEDAIDEKMKAHAFDKKEFYANKGDILIWHANLVHGGSPIINKGATRRSMVVHYFAKDVIKYHEITERPSLMEY